MAIRGKQIAAAAAGDGLKKDASGNFSVEPNDFAGTGLVDDGSDNLKVDPASTVTFSGATWTFPVDELQVTGTPDSANDAVNKSYADGIAAGISWKVAVIASSTQDLESEAFGATGVTYANGTLGVGATLTQDDATDGVFGSLDGVAISLNDRVLIQDQGTGGEDGIYELTAVGNGVDVAWVLTRVVDADVAAELDAAAVFVQQGTTLKDIGFVQTASNLTVGTTALVFSQFTGTSPLSAGDGIDIGSNVVSVDLKASAGLKIDTTELAVEPNDFAGTGLEDDGSDNLRLAQQGNGIAGGNGSTLSIDVDSETGGNVQPANLTANGVGVDINAIAGTGIEADGSANVRLASQGNGISGGAGSTLSVDADSETGGDILPVSVGANGVGIDIAAIDGTGLSADGSAALDIDTASTVTFSGATWTFPADDLQINSDPDSANDAVRKSFLDAQVSEPTSSNKAMTASVTSSDFDAATATAIASTPTNDGHVGVLINGMSEEVGDGVKTKACFFSGDAGTNARSLAAIVATDTCHWVGSVAGYELDATDKVDFIYNV